MNVFKKSLLIITPLLLFTVGILAPQAASSQALPKEDDNNYEPGCFTIFYTAEEGVRKVTCGGFESENPGFKADPNKCYFRWLLPASGQLSKPVHLNCQAGPTWQTPPIFPKDNTAGNGPATSPLVTPPNAPPPGPTPTPGVHPGTQKYSPGCYIEVMMGFQKVDCSKFKDPFYPSFNPSPEKCYFGWAITGFGPSAPVMIDCEKGPGIGAPRIAPLDNIPGNGEKEAGVPGPPKQTIDAELTTFESDQCNGKAVTPTDNCILDNINTVINVLSAGVGIIVIITIITAGIQYITAGGDPQKISQAKNRIRNALFALLAFAFLFAFLQWIVPGGILP